MVKSVSGYMTRTGNFYETEQDAVAAEAFDALKEKYSVALNAPDGLAFYAFYKLCIELSTELESYLVAFKAQQAQYDAMEDAEVTEMQKGVRYDAQLHNSEKGQI